MQRPYLQELVAKAAASSIPLHFEQYSDDIEVLHALPSQALQQPYLYLSSAQHDACSRNPLLAAIAPRLPAWVPHRAVAHALGFGQVTTSPQHGSTAAP